MCDYGSKEACYLESKFKLDDVFYTATGEYLPPENDLKAAVKDCSEHEILPNVAKFLEERNGIIEAFNNGKLPLLPYTVLLTDSDKLREKLPHGVVTMWTFSSEIEDELGIMRKVTFKGEIKTEELPAPTLMEGYETHCKETLGKDELTVLTVRRHIALRQNQTNLPPPPYSNQTEYEAWLKTIDLRNDNETVSEFIAAMTETAEKFDGKFVTDEAENLRTRELKRLPEIKVEWGKKIAAPFVSPTGLILGEQTADTRLLAELQDLMKEAYAVAQRMESKKGESFFTLLKNLLPKRHKGVLLTPEDAKEAI
jgi:hypothetical protein